MSATLGHFLDMDQNAVKWLSYEEYRRQKSEMMKTGRIRL
jgi:hypothetical protein